MSRVTDAPTGQRVEHSAEVFHFFRDGRLLEERSIDEDEDNRAERKTKRPARSVTVNVAESPLGWLLSRGLISRLQFDAGERLRMDWERAQIAPNVTMSWDAASIEAEVRDYAENKGLKLGKVAQPLRAALSGSTVSPPIFEEAELLGKTETLARIADIAQPR